MTVVGVTRLVPTLARRIFPFPSVGFSGAGFLGCYHVGVAACLLKHGHLLRPGEVPLRTEAEGGNGSCPPILTGVSAGSIVSLGISAGIRPEDSMDIILEIARRTKERGGALDVLRPGFSLVDQVSDLVLGAMRRALGGTGEDADDYDRELFLRRIRGGRLLRIGLTDRRKFSLTTLHTDMTAYCYVDGYRDLEDAVAASIISSYIPGLTGTLRGPSCPHNAAVRWAWERIQEMQFLGFVKDGQTGQSVHCDGSGPSKGDRMADMWKFESHGIAPPPDSDELIYWDGGLANLCPTIDDFTVMVAPLHGSYSPNPSISPVSPDLEIKNTFSEESAMGVAASASAGEVANLQSRNNADRFSGKLLFQKYLNNNLLTFQVHERIKMGIDFKNLETLYRMMRSSDGDVLQERFRSGYDDARRFLEERNMLMAFSA